MKKKKSHLTQFYYSLFLLLTAAGFLFFSELPAYARDNSENQIWQENSVQKKFINLIVKASAQNRWRKNSHIYSHSEISMVYKLNKLWTIGAGWRNVEKKSKKGDWRTDYFSHLDIVNKLSASSAGIKNRVQFAYTCRYKGKDTPDVRYRVDLYPSRSFSAIKISPYLAGELLYDFDASHVYWIRQFTGLRASPYKWFGFDLYLMRQEDKKPGKPQCEKYIYGLSARLKF